MYHPPADDGQHKGADKDTNRGARHDLSAPGSLRLNALSNSVRRFMKHSSDRWWETPGGANTLLMILLDGRYSYTEGGGSALHPLLGVVVLKRLGFSVWSGSSADHGGWAARCGLSAEDLSKVAECVLQPLLPHAKTHVKVRPLLPLIVEWLLCISDMPLHVWLSHLSLCVDDFTTVNAETLHRTRPLLSFLLIHLAPRYSLLQTAGSSCETPLKAGQVLCKMLQLLLSWQEGSLNGATVDLPQNSSGYTDRYAKTTGDLVQTLFWGGDAPLLLYDAIRRAYKRLTYSARLSNVDPCSPEEHTTEMYRTSVLMVPIADDDVFRRLLLRLLCPSPCTLSSQASLDDMVLIEPLLQLEDPSIILRFITPLSEFVTVVMDRGLSAPLRLSFKGIQEVIYSSVKELQRLRTLSTYQSVLLPHKPRIHTLMSLSKRLLADVEQKQQRQMNGEKESYDDERSFLFPGESLQQQLHVLRFLCRATQRLVRGVMEEKAASLLAEGPEGSVLQSGGAVAAHTDVTASLRNTAFRVLETSLLQYYKALDEGLSSSSRIQNGRKNIHGDNPVGEKVTEIERHAGGRAMLLTAQHLLKYPLRQETTAVVEGLRLVAIQALVLHSPPCEEWLLDGGFTQTVADAFFGVWHRTLVGWAEPSTWETKEVEGSRTASKETEHRICERLLWTMLLLHQHYCSCCAGVPMAERVWIDSEINGCGLLRSLLDLLTSCSASTELEGLRCWSLSPGCEEVNSSDEGSRKRKQRVVRPSVEGGVMGGCTTRWRLQEELFSLAGEGGGRWRWLGGTSAVQEVASNERRAGYVGFLLPWSTVAYSRHPLRLYDESGQSSDAAARFDETITTLLQLQGMPVLRVVSIAEEATIFRDMTSTAEFSLGPGVIIANPEVHREAVVIPGSEDVNNEDDDMLD